MMTQKEYLSDKHGGRVCPNCKSEDVDRFWSEVSYDSDSNVIGIPAYCVECRSTWKAEFTASGYKDLQVPEREEEE